MTKLIMTTTLNEVDGELGEYVTISDPFQVDVDNGQLDGMVTIVFTNRNTGEECRHTFDANTEALRGAISEAAVAVERCLLGNKGFRISPLPGAWNKFLHYLLFPEPYALRVQSK